MPSQREKDQRLFKAVVACDVNEVKAAVENGANVNAYTNVWYHHTPLHIAAREGYSKLISILLQAKANPSLTDECEATPLHLAAREGHHETVKILLQLEVNPNVIDEYENTPLHLAAKNGHSNIVSLLLKFGGHPTVINEYGNTPLHLAARGGHTEIVQLLLDSKADPECINDYDYTPSHLAAQGGYTKIVQLIVEAGGNPNAVDYCGDTILHDACTRGHIDLVEYLLSIGVDTTIENDEGLTAMETILSEREKQEKITALFDAFKETSSCFEQVMLDKTLEWNISNSCDVQCFDMSKFGIKLIVPPASVPEDRCIKVKVQIIAPDIFFAKLHANFKPVSCFYKICPSETFLKPIQLYIQHNADVQSLGESNTLAFVTSKGPPHVFKVSNANQEFPAGNTGVVLFSDSATFGIVSREKNIVCSYVMTPFYNNISERCWQMKVFVTKNLGPYIEKMKSDRSIKEWIQKDPVPFCFDSEKNSLALIGHNDSFTSQPLLVPCAVNKEDVEDSNFNSFINYLYFEVELVDDSKCTNLELLFDGTKDETTMKIPLNELLLHNGSMDDTHPTCVTIVKEEDTGKNERVSEINDRIDEDISSDKKAGNNEVKDMLTDKEFEAVKDTFSDKEVDIKDSEMINTISHDKKVNFNEMSIEDEKKDKRSVKTERAEKRSIKSCCNII